MRARLGFGAALMKRSRVILIDETRSLEEMHLRDQGESRVSKRHRGNE